MTSEWKKCRLGDLVTFTSGGTPSKQKAEYWNGNIPWISAKAMKNERISTSNLMISEDGLNNGSRLAPKGSILFLIRGSGLFNGIPICLVEQPVAFNQDVKCIESCSEIENKYIFYWLLAQSSKLSAMVGVTTIGAGKFDMDVIKNLEISYPPAEIRKEIIKISDAISEKIHLNVAINDNLEQQAQAIFKAWFVDFEPFGGVMPDDWRIGTASEIIELHDSKRVPLSGAERDKMEKIFPYYGATSRMDYVDNYLFDGIYLLLGEDGTVIDENGFPILQYVYGKFWVNNHAHIITGKLGYSVESLYLLFGLTNIKNIVTGAVQQKISQTNLKKVSVIIPDSVVLKEFDNIIQPIFAAIRNNRDEIERLSALRDTLLPKLMNGEIDVSAVKI